MKIIKNRFSEYGNLLIIGAMGVFWFTPLIRFWGAVYGPFRPYSYPTTDVTPALISMLAGTLLCLMPLSFPRVYYRCWENKRGIHAYELIGVRTFKRFATNGDLINRWARRLDAGYRLVKNKDSASILAENTINGERGHMVLLVLGFFSAAYALYIGWLGWFIGLSISNIVFNVYPVILQRYNRCRVERCCKLR